MAGKWLGVDGTNWVHQLWHATGGKGTLAALANRLAALVAFLQPETTVVAFDRRSFRHDLLATYKAGRGERDESLNRELAAAPAICHRQALVAQQDGMEADDCLATFAAVGLAQGAQVVLASPDKDLRQCLVPGRVTVLKSFKTSGGTFAEPAWYTAADLGIEYGLLPEQWPDYQILVGDKGDGIDGCPGWGEKTAAAVLAKVGTIEACYRQPFSLPCTARQRAQLQNYRSRVPLVRQLVTLRTNVEAVYDALR